MHSVSSRWRKPKGRPNKRRRKASENALKQWQDIKTDEKENHSTDDEVLSSDAGIVTSDAEIVTSDAGIVTSDAGIVRRETGVNINEGSGAYTIMDQDMWSSLLKNVTCSECSSSSMQVITKSSFGLSNNLELTCGACGHSYGSTFSSNRSPLSKKFDVNNKFVRGFLSIGRGYAALETFSMILGIPAMNRKTFSNCLNELTSNNPEVKLKVLQLAWETVRSRYIEMEPSLADNDTIDISVTYDGTWHRRGHTSLYGIGIVMDMLTGLVLDFEILCKHCQECANSARDLGADSPEFHVWRSGHESECQKNLNGSSNSMETSAAHILWSRSIDLSKMRYTTVLSDGGSKAYLALVQSEVYGKDTVIAKEECINHVAKRLGTALRGKVKEWKGQGLTLGGRKKGSLTDDGIKLLQGYYRKSIKTNAPNVHNMKTAVLATLYHCISTDQKPQHAKCPKGEKSWCFWQVAQATGKKPKPHSKMKTQLSPLVVEKILPVYQRLSATELLKKCVAAKTQNANECLHICIWNKCPKEIFV